jgi:hypothetical protein
LHWMWERIIKPIYFLIHVPLTFFYFPSENVFGASHQPIPKRVRVQNVLLENVISPFDH